MYYEEKIIDGVLMFRNRPEGDWKKCSVKIMSERIINFKEHISELEDQIGDLKACLRTCASSAQGGLDQYK